MPTTRPDPTVPIQHVADQTTPYVDATLARVQVAPASASAAVRLYALAVATIYEHATRTGDGAFLVLASDVATLVATTEQHAWRTLREAADCRLIRAQREQYVVDDTTRTRVGFMPYDSRADR